MKKKFMMLYGEMSSEKKVEDIPLSPGVNLEELKKGDNDPLEVVVSIPASKSTRGWYYTPQALRSIVDKVNADTLAGFLGHQKPDEVSNQFLPPVTHWVGAQMEGETAYFRGVVDAASADLKRWIRSGRVKQVSIFGRPKLQQSHGETQVVDYEGMSIDWTPLDRAGMKTSIVAMSGEMWDADGEGPEKNGGVKKMNPEELLKEVKKMFENKQLTMTMIAGEMSLSAEQVVGELDQTWLQEKTNAETQLKAVESALGVSGEMSVVEAAKEAAKAVRLAEQAKFDQVVGEMMETGVKSEAVRKDMNDSKTTIGRMWSYHREKLKPEMTKEQLSGEMDAFMKDPVVVDLVSRYHTDQPPGVSSSSQTNQQSTAVRKRQANI